ncbi:MAG: DUF192 domain-containing protein [Phycisphaerales bacterium]
MAARHAMRRLAMLGAITAGAGLGACDPGMAGGDAAQPAAAGDDAPAPETLRVRVGSETFRLELALDNETRTLGLGGRDEIARDGGMLFVFPQAAQLSFVMRDCPIPIDVAFLDGGGRVVAIHEMQPEAPRGENEGFWEYENRLKRYSSRYAAQFVIETAGGRLKETGLAVGDLVPIDTETLKKRVR